MPNGQEVRLLCALLAEPPNESLVKSLLGSDLDWHLFEEHAEFHRILPALQRSIQSLSAALLPESVQLWLTSRCNDLAKQNILLTAELLSLQKELEAQRIRFAAFKGPVLAVAGYQDLFARQFADLDLLVDEANATNIALLLSKRGYKPVPDSFDDTEAFITSKLFKQLSVHEFTFRHRQWSAEIDVHWFLYRKHELAISTAALLENTKPVSIQGRLVPSLAPPYQIISVAWNATAAVYGMLNSLMDFVHLRKSFHKSDWDEAFAIADELDCRRALTVPMAMTSYLFGVRWDYAIDEKSERMARECCERLFLCKQPQTLRRLIFRMKLRETLSGRLRYALGDLLTPTATEWGRLQLPLPLFFLYRALRPWWLATDFCARSIRKLT